MLHVCVLFCFSEWLWLQKVAKQLAIFVSMHPSHDAAAVEKEKNGAFHSELNHSVIKYF